MSDPHAPHASANETSLQHDARPAAGQADQPGSERRIAACFAKAAAARRKVLIPFITAGDPTVDTTLALMKTLVEAGADIIELGVPFSDPMADGPVIQAAGDRALLNGTSLRDVIALVARFRADDVVTPVVLMGYMNPVERLGFPEFARLAADAGVDGVLTVDLPPEEAGPLASELQECNLDTVLLLSPTSPDERIRQVCQSVSGYVYYVSLKGVTGAATIDTGEVAAKVRHIQTLSNTPVAVGFGIRDAESAAAISRTADAVVVGSVLVALVGEHGHDLEKVRSVLFEHVHAMRQAMDVASVESLGEHA